MCIRDRRRGWRRSCAAPSTPTGTGARGRKLGPAPGPVPPRLPFLGAPNLPPAFCTRRAVAGPCSCRARRRGRRADR
eukprot:11233968-Alexandrium_andersonii.AAC.1